MTANDFDTLHEKSEPRMRGMMSMLDMMGASITCDDCGRWQRLGTISQTDALKKAEASGWIMKDGRDRCPVCVRS